MKTSRKIFVFLFCLLMVLQLIFPASAATGSVTYQGQADGFIFSPGSTASPTSLFPNFQNVMPGDVLTQKILIKNDASKHIKIRVYLRSLGAKSGSEELLSYMKLTVEQDGDSILYAGPADETGDLTDWVFLGTIYSGGEITLDLLLEVSPLMGDEFQNEIGYLDWEFKIEELPVSTSDPNAPQTGDDFPMLLLCCAMGLSLFILIILLIKKRTDQDKEDRK